MKFHLTTAISTAVFLGLSSAIPRPQNGGTLDGSCSADAAHNDIMTNGLKNCMESAQNAATLVMDVNNAAAQQKIRERFGVEPDDAMRQRIATQFKNIYNACAGNLNTVFKCNNDGPCANGGATAYACLGCNQNGYVNMCPSVFEPNGKQIGCDGENNAAVFIHEASHNFGETDADGAGKFQRLAMQLRPECINEGWPGGDQTDPLKNGQQAYATNTPATLYDKNGPVQTPAPGRK